MLRVTQLKVLLEEDQDSLKDKIRAKLKIGKNSEFTYHIHKKNIDARDKERIYFVYSVDVTIQNEKVLLKKHLKDVSRTPMESRKPLVKGVHYLNNPPIVVGFGPAGMFAALLLAQYGYCPIVLERGDQVEKRDEKVTRFFQEGILDEESNIQFGEGGAGTFSDGKLTARSKDPRVQKVYETFVKFGAPKEILYESFPHVGSDKLKGIIKNIRNEIISLGGEIHFNTKVEEVLYEEGSVSGVLANHKKYDSKQVILALGNSARDTFENLYNQGIKMQSKPLAVGFRIEHKQSLINEALYHQYANHPLLQGGSYRLSYQCENGKGVYTFCMCPGGSVVAATSSRGRVVVNGMSNYARDEENANSAILVQVDEKEYGEGVLAGMHYLDELEKKAYQMGGNNYQAPCQSVCDYLNNTPSVALKEVTPSYPLGVKLSNLNSLFSEALNASLHEGLRSFHHKMQGFCNEDAILTGVETRSSCPVRFLRDSESLNAIDIQGLYPCGEGAGYAGGIVSSAIDGLKCAEKIIQSWNYDK